MSNRPRWISVSLYAAFVAVGLTVVPASASPKPYGEVPAYFEENAGQTDPVVRFLARGIGYALFITDRETVAVLRQGENEGSSAVVRMKLAGANQHPVVTGEELLAGKSHYLIGNTLSGWRRNVAQYGKVRVAAVYPGIDVVYYGNRKQLEYDFIVQPGSDPGQIRLQFDGAARIELDAAGALLLHLGGGTLRQDVPVVYQEVNGARRQVRAAYRRLNDREVAVDVASFDSTRALIIDPVLSYSTYLGGSGLDTGRAIAVDSSGSAYVTGYTDSLNFPAANALQGSTGGGRDAFVAKLNAAGTALVYCTYLGGNSSDEPQGIAVDGSGNAFITGVTRSTNFPIANAIDASNDGFLDVFVTKLNAAGSALVYSTYLGGNGADEGAAIALDSSGNAYLTGETSSTDFPTSNAVQASNRGSGDLFVTKLNAAGTALVYSTYLGGSDDDTAAGIAVDGAGSAYIAGTTLSTNFPTANALQGTSGGSYDALVVKLNAAGTALVYSTYLGGNDGDTGFDIALDSLGNAYMTGITLSTNFPTANALQASIGVYIDAYVSKLNAAGTALVYSTYLGGNSTDYGIDIAVDSLGSAYVTGWTESTNFPTVNPLQPGYNGNTDAYVTKLTAAGTALVYSTYLGGTAGDSMASIALDSSANAYLTGSTSSTNFPTANAAQASNAGGSADVVLVKITGPPRSRRRAVGH